MEMRKFYLLWAIIFSIYISPSHAGEFDGSIKKLCDLDKKGGRWRSKQQEIVNIYSGRCDYNTQCQKEAYAKSVMEASVLLGYSYDQLIEATLPLCKTLFNKLDKKKIESMSISLAVFISNACSGGEVKAILPEWKKDALFDHSVIEGRKDFYRMRDIVCE